jgi:selenocysteine-specific elongation factor
VVNTSFFDAVLDSLLPLDDKSFEVMLHLKGDKIRATVFPYQKAKDQSDSNPYVRLYLSRPLHLHWGDRFTLRGWNAPGYQAGGKVLNPFKKKVKPSELKKRPELLERLSGSEKEMLLAKIQEGGIHGLREEDIASFCSLSRKTLVKLSHELEEKGELKILSFLPLHLLARASFDYLCDQVLAYLSQFHTRNPGEIGVHMESVGVRFKLPPRIVSLAVKQLSRSGQVTEYGDLIAQAGFRVKLSAEEEELLKDLEEMSLKGELHSVSFEELKKRFHLSSRNLNRLLDFLVERKKIVKGKDGYIIHSRWLEELIQRLRNSGKRELSVSEFKTMTGLSRKYAIPLLELLDQMGVTRRRGPGREIL